MTLHTSIRDGGGELDWDFSQPGRGAICDFCGSVDPIKQYPARSFLCFGTNPPILSPGAWAACVPCSRLIDAEAHLELLERAIRRIGLALGRPLTDDERRIAATLQEGFWRGR